MQVQTFHYCNAILFSFSVSLKGGANINCDDESITGCVSNSDEDMFQPKSHSTQKPKQLKADKARMEPKQAQPHLNSRVTKEKETGKFTTIWSVRNHLSFQFALLCALCAGKIILTLPTKGEEEWQINQNLLAAIEADNLFQHIDPFLLVCARHLLKTVKLEEHNSQRKSIYNRYSQMIVNQHSCLADPDPQCEAASKKHRNYVIRLKRRLTFC